MTYHYATKSGALKSFEAANDAAAQAMLRSFPDADPRSGVMKAPAAASPAAPTATPPTPAAVAAALAKNKDFQQYGGANSTEAVLNAFQTGDWSGVTDLTGKPFTDKQQKAAVAAAEAALAPAYKAQEAYDRAGVEDTLAAEARDYGDFLKTEEQNFGASKDQLDQDAADQGVLFSGSRYQKLNDLRNTYQDRERIARQQSADRITSTVRGQQYEYGNSAATKLKDMYQLPGTASYDANVAGGKVTRPTSLSSVYNPSQYDFQGTKPVAQKAQVQTRAAAQLANRSNKLSLSGYGTKF